MRIMFFKVKNGKVYDIDYYKRKAIAIGLPVTITFITCTNQVYAATNIGGQLKPIINALQDLAEPVSYAFMIYGGIQYAGGKTSEGKKTLKNAIGGYILVQWLPWIFSIIKGIGKQ